MCARAEGFLNHPVQCIRSYHPNLLDAPRDDIQKICSLFCLGVERGLMLLGKNGTSIRPKELCFKWETPCFMKVRLLTSAHYAVSGQLKAPAVLPTGKRLSWKLCRPKVGIMTLPQVLFLSYNLMLHFAFLWDVRCQDHVTPRTKFTGKHRLISLPLRITSSASFVAIATGHWAEQSKKHFAFRHFVNYIFTNQSDVCE